LRAQALQNGRDLFAIKLKAFLGQPAVLSEKYEPFLQQWRVNRRCGAFSGSLLAAVTWIET
jgi:hypothetical protein